MSKVARYKDGVAWVARNDDPGSLDAQDVEVLSGMMTVALLADLFAMPAHSVAEDIVRFRQKEDG